jgi:hypothetical protein
VSSALCGLGVGRQFINRDSWPWCLDECVHAVLFRMFVDLPLDHMDVPVYGKGVSAAARDVVGTKMLGCDPEVGRSALQFLR